MPDSVEVHPAVLYASKRKWALVSAAAGVIFVIVGLVIEGTTDLNGLTFIGLGIVFVVMHGSIALWAHRKSVAARQAESQAPARDLESD